MVASPAPVPPAVFKAMLERLGYAVVNEDEDNWGLFKGGQTHPILIIPKDGDLLSLEVMMSTLDRLKIDDGTFFGLLKDVTGQ